MPIAMVWKSSAAGHGGKTHEGEENGAPEPSAGHPVENVIQRDEDKARSRIGTDAESKAGGKNNKGRAIRLCRY